MEGFQYDRVYDRVVIQVGKYNAELQRWSVGSLLVFIITVSALVSLTGVIVLLVTDWLLCMALVWFLRTQTDDESEILTRPARAALYGFLRMQQPISLEIVSSQETAFWQEMVKKYSELNTRALLLDIPNAELENIMAQEVIRKLRAYTVVRKLYDKIRVD